MNIGRREEVRNPIEPPVRPPERVQEKQEQHQHEVERPPIREQIDRMARQKLPHMRNFLFVVNDAESSDKVLVKAPNIMLALIKFSQRYHDECADWMTIALFVEEVETVE
jgi:hypothetical protein